MFDLGKPLMWAEPPSVGEAADATFRLPAGTVTFLMTDIEGSTRLWEHAPDAMAPAIADSYAILDAAITRHGGVRPLEQGEGDSVVAAFSRASDALAAALQAQRGWRAHTWPDGTALRVRIALHTADAQLRDEGNYFGLALSRCARLRAIARGGQTLLSRATRDLVVDRLPEGVELVDCGVQRLRDLGRPEHVYALAHPELPTDLGPLRSLDTFPTNLPDQLTTFVGRARELSEVHAALEETRLLTLTGAGGAGKTRLALQLAADVLDRFPDGAWWVELAPLAEPRLVGEALAAALGVRPLPGVTALQASCAHLAERRALVLLDNCEHLLAACAEATEALLHGCPAVAVIATSRTPLGVAGETDWRVPSLSLPGPEPEREAIQALDQSDAVRLFIERARKARPNFAVTNDNAPEVVRICQGLDGLPLAIELAAARVRMLSVEQIAAGLGDRFHLLTGGARTALPRHQTLRASVDWSHDLLSDRERVLFRRLSVFAGGFTLDACEEVGSGEGLERAAILDLLASLVDKSLVVAEERGAAVRYRMLETVREYASERLAEAGEFQHTRTRHRDAFVAFAERAAPELEGAGQCAWLDLLDPEAGNLAAALEWAARTDGERALRLCAALTLWWRFRGLFSAADVGFARALEVADPAPSALRARVLWGRAHLQTFMGRYEQSLATVQQAMAMAEEVGDASTHARTLDEIGAIQLWLAPVESRPLLERSCELARSAGDDWCLVYAGVNLGIAYLICDEHEEAQRQFDTFLPLAEQQGLRESIALALVGEGLNAVYRGDAERGVERLDRALAESDALGEPVIEGLAHVTMGALELAQGRPDAALARLESSRERTIAAGAGMPLPYIETFAAAAHGCLGDANAARARLEAVVASGADGGRALAFAMLELARVLRNSGDDTGAEAWAQQAHAIGRRMAIPHVSALSNETLGRVAAGRGEWTEAESRLHDSLATMAERELRFYTPQVLDALAEVAAGLGSHAEAARILGAAHRMRADLGLARWAPDEPSIAELERALRAGLGDEAYDAAHTEGAALTMAEAVAWVRRARGERRRPARGWESLTRTELRVVELVAEGLTNPQIGERMFITRGTVKVHLAHVFDKLDVATRAELAAAATRRRASA